MTLTKQDLSSITGIIHGETRKIVNGQSAMKSELIAKIDGLESKVDKGLKNVNERIDKLGKSLAYLEDDTPTRDEFDDLEVRVKKVEIKVASV